MRNGQRKGLFSLLLIPVALFSIGLILCLPVEKVEAESSERQDYICYARRNYQITEVKVDGEPASFTKEERDAFFDYLANHFSDSGSIEYNGKTYTYRLLDKGTCDCPSQANLDAIKDVYNYKVINNGNTSTINFGVLSNVKAKVITNLSQHINNPEDWLAGGYELEPTGGEFRLTVPAGESFYVVFYAADPSCDSTALTYVQGAASSMISNPYYDAPICVNYRNQHASDTIFASLVPECYSETISAQQNITQATIQNKINNANNLIQKVQTTPVNDKKQCDFTSDNNVTEEYVYTDFLKDENGQSIGGEYWQAICTEKVRVWYDTPKELTAGEGFNYITHISVERECTPQKIKEPTIPVTCTYGADCIGEHLTGFHVNDLGAGPTEEFDQCVQFCDGGKYSQSCIDSCYQEIYQNNNTSGMSNDDETKPGYLKLDVTENVISAKQVADSSFSESECKEVLGKVYVRHFKDHLGNSYAYPTRGPLSSCRYITGHCPNGICYTEHGVAAVFLQTCDAGQGQNIGGVACYEVYTSSTDCAEPGHEYEAYLARVNEAKRQFDEVNEAIRQLNMDEADYVIEVTDSVSKKVTTYDTNNSDNTVDVTTAGAPVMSESNSQSVLIAPGGWGVSEVNGTVSTVNISQTYTLGVDKAYFLATSRNNILYGSGAYNRLNANEQVKYLDGGNKWYSNPYAKAYNLLEYWPTIIGFDNQNAITSSDSRLDQNIKVKIKQFGSWQQIENLDIDCFYGISSCGGLFCDNPGDSACNSDTEVCDGGIQYIFRPIELTNPFPSRAPRYNWSLAATDNSNSYYRIDPVAFTSDMVSKGQTIYGALNTPWTIDKDGNNVTGVAQNGGDTSELDYEIILNRDNIRAIRNYNKKYSGDSNDGYLEYDMTCRFDSLSQRTICTSNFLSNKNADSSNGNYVHMMKRGTAGCNNERNGECYNYPTVSRAGDSNE